MLWAVSPAAIAAEAAPSDPSLNRGYAAQKGIIDLTDWDPNERPTILLSGEWEFYWGRLLAPADFNRSSASSPAYVQVPSPWTEYEINGEHLAHEGYATFRLRFLLPDKLAESRETLGFYPKSIASSYKLWINGNPKGGNGIVGIDRNGSKPSSYPSAVYFEPLKGWNEIVIQVSNFSQRNAGIWQSMELGTAEAVSWLRISRVSAQVFIVGIFVVMSLYYLFLYFNRKQELSALFFGLLCFAVGIRTIVLGETTALYLLPSLPWEWAVKAEYISVSMTALTLIQFIDREYPKESVRTLPIAFSIVLAGCILFFLFTPARVYTYYLAPFTWGALFPCVAYTLYIYVLSAMRRRKGSFTNAIGFMIFTVFALNDMLFYSGLLPTNDMLSIGVLAFLITQAVNLSARFSRAMDETELLSEQLRQSNISLERTVEERTRSLRETNSRLQEANAKMADIEKFRIKLLSNVSHELSTPITSIKGFAKALRDGIITDEAPKYASRIYERSLLLERLIRDLFELTKLETNQVEFHLQEVDLLPFFRHLFLKYEWEIKQRHQFRLILPEPDHGHASLCADLDPLRIEQVLSNLISNAVRHTPPDGVISLQLDTRHSETSGFAVIRVKDTGVGIEPEMHQSIFERYRQVETSQSKEHGGSGLGLAISREIVHFHGGEITVDSTPGSGSIFSFVVPIRRKGGNQHVAEA